jgi:hypothetical protein
LIADYLAQLFFVVMMVLCATPEFRRAFPDMMDGNVERVEREERLAEEARWWLEQMGVQPVEQKPVGPLVTFLVVMFLVITFTIATVVAKLLTGL